MTSQNLAHLISELEKVQPQKASDVVTILKRLPINKRDLMPFAEFDHKLTDSYGRKMVYKGDNYEIMVMSWNTGDFSAIHDHGYTQWGAVKVFGKAEHATFRWEDEDLKTLARWIVADEEVLGVGHSLIHQMGNKDQEPFISLHVYGHKKPIENITGEARIFDPVNQKIQRVNGGAFLNLLPHEITQLEEGPKGDFPTSIRFLIELFRRKSIAKDHSSQEVFSRIFNGDQKSILLNYLEEISDAASGKVSNSTQWKVLKRELIEAAQLQIESDKSDSSKDKFHRYAEVYDEVIGKTSYESFMENYIEFFQKKYEVHLEDTYTLSIGCGTGLVEKRITDKYKLTKDSIYGMDLSESMISEAKKRINADVGDLLDLDPGVRKWDVAFSGLNVFQYLPHQSLETAISKTSEILNSGGYFLGDFITPDHIRWYPNIMFSGDKSVISLRTPRLIEEKGASFQESEIININFLHEKMEVNYAGKHRRFLPPIYRVRNYFEKYFKTVELFDAVTLEPILSVDDSCTSTRYIVIAQKK